MSIFLQHTQFLLSKSTHSICERAHTVTFHLAAFASRYNDNMIEQSFVERRPERGAKFLCTLNVKCVSASLKQHGLGVVSSAVNVSYKLLAKVRVIYETRCRQTTLLTFILPSLLVCYEEISIIYPFSSW